MIRQQPFTSPEEALTHFGVKGMRWGVRKTKPIDLQPQSAGVTIRKDGSIDVAKGASLQRLVRSSGASLPMKDITYASLNDYDNSRYVKIIGGKGFLGGGRDRMLSIQAVKPIKAPSVNEATKIVSEMMVKDAVFRQKNTDILNRTISDKELKALKDEPTGKVAKAWYDNTNQKLTFDKGFDPDAPHVQKAVREEMERRGYNALRDENDVRSKIAKAPIIIFNPQDSLAVVKMTDITDGLRKANKAKLKQYKKNGKQWLDSELYT